MKRIRHAGAAVALLALLLASTVTGGCDAGAISDPVTKPAPPTRTEDPPRPTSTPTPSPAPTSTPTPPGKYFIDEFESGAYYWDVHLSSGTGPPTTRVESGAYIMSLDRPNLWAYSLLNVREYDDVRVNARFQFRGVGTAAGGVLCRYMPDQGWYEFNLSTDGLYSVLLGEWAAPEVARYTPIVYDESEYLDPTSPWFEAGLGCDGHTLWLYINGKLIRKLDVTRFGLLEGRIGVSAATFEHAPLVVAFDWIQVGEP
jgi:hypothetical protein